MFGTEQYLEQCLSSVKDQTYTDYEVIVVNDGSTGVDSQGNCCKKIIKNIKKKYKLPINYIEHSENKGLLEARRTAIYAATGDYIFNLDSDDKLPPDALENLYNVAVETGADIVHGKGELFSAGDVEIPVDVKEEEVLKAKEHKLKKITNVYMGEISGSDIFNGYLVEKNHCGFLWGKLYKRELYLEAFDKIPPMFCTMAEDVIQYFWLTYFAKKYVGINKCVYEYCDNTGVTSNKTIDNLEKWEQVCSVASVFTAIYTSLEELNVELEEKQRDRISKLCCYYVGNNLQQLNGTVVPELKNDAYNILCDYWGASFVSKIEAILKEKENNNEKK